MSSFVPPARLAAAVLAAAFAAALPAGAAGHPKSAPPDLAADLRALAQQRPWLCKAQPDGRAPLPWSGGQAQCAWQERLSMRRWEGAGGEAPGACVSAQALWWTWARGARPLAWHAQWPSQAVVDGEGTEQRIVIMQRGGEGRWSVTEWTWRPSPRAATRRWQQARWSLLAARAREFAQPVPAGEGTREARMLRSVLLANVGARTAETGNGILNYASDGLCLQADAASPGQQVLQVPYAPDDSRLEQRAAMQLQLARRFPSAQWLAPFSLVPAPPGARGGAKFYALWLDRAILNGQLWIPTRGGGPLVRVRITTALPPKAATGPDAPAVVQARHVILRELMGVAARWSYQYE